MPAKKQVDLTLKSKAAKRQVKTQVKHQVERILLPANMEIGAMDEAFGLLRSKYPPSCQKYVLDGAQLNLIDASGIQLLVNFANSVKQKGCKVEWDNYSLQAHQLANELGLVDKLGD